MMNVSDHQLDDEGEHCEEDCEVCIEQTHTVQCECKCGKCCEQLILEASLRDGEREPKVKALPIIKGFFDEPDGYWLNSKDGPCVFLDREHKLCTIHETRPLMCRVYNCDEERARFETRLIEISRLDDNSTEDEVSR